MNLVKMTCMIQEINKDLATLNSQPLHCDAGYMRVCDRDEPLADALAEAKSHGSILAFKGEATVIMPRLIDGWTEYGRPLQ